MESDLVAEWLHFLHHVFEVVSVDLGSSQNLKVGLFLDLENSAIYIEFALARHCFQKIFNLRPVTVENQLSKKLNLL